MLTDDEYNTLLKYYSYYDYELDSSLLDNTISTQPLSEKQVQKILAIRTPEDAILFNNTTSDRYKDIKIKQFYIDNNTHWLDDINNVVNSSDIDIPTYSIPTPSAQEVLNNIDETVGTNVDKGINKVVSNNINSKPMTEVLDDYIMNPKKIAMLSIPSLIATYLVLKDNDKQANQRVNQQVNQQYKQYN